MSKWKKMMVMGVIAFVGVISGVLFGGKAYAGDVKITYTFTVSGKDAYVKAANAAENFSKKMNAGTLTQTKDAYKAKSGKASLKLNGNTLTVKAGDGFWGPATNVANKLKNSMYCTKDPDLNVSGLALPGPLKETGNAVLSGLKGAGAKYVCKVGATSTETVLTMKPKFTVATSGEDIIKGKLAGAGDETKTTCMNSDGAKSLGWIVCPIMTWMSDASEELYDNYIEPALQVQPKLFTGGGKDTKKGWEVFRNIANILMVILLLLVIFSQITGVGINNYGIKQILPKLILAAVLMNLSYWLCVIFIDLSNILGNGLQALFDGLATNLSGLNVGIEGEKTSLGADAGGLVSIGVVTTLFSWSAMAWSNPAVLLTLFISLLGMMVSIFFLFIILSVREAAIVVLVVLSPIAVACMMMPNTKSWFDKWKKFFGSLLLVYPIAGLLVGGGNYVSRLMLAAGTGTFWTFTAMLAGIVPIFFIPTVLKSSLSMAGNLGAKISGIGAGVGRKVQSGVANTDAVRNAQQRGLERRTRIRAGVRQDENGNWVADESIGRIGRIMRGGNRGMARARKQFIGDQKEDEAVNRMADSRGTAFNAAMVAQQKANAADMTNDYMALIRDKTRNGEDEGALNDMLSDYIMKGDKSGATAVARLMGRRKDTASRFSDTFANGRYKGSDGQEHAIEIGGEIKQAMAKEMATGENSANYRAAEPIRFEYAAQMNSGSIAPSVSYADWSGDANNIHNALDHNITNSQELAGMKGSALTELNGMMGGMNEADRTRIRGMARELLANQGKPGAPAFDTTKKGQIQSIAGQSQLTRGGSSGEIHEIWTRQGGR